MVIREGGRSVVIGFDGRLLSPVLEKALVKGTVESGADVIRISCGPTPMLYFGSVVLKADGAIMVTGSHFTEIRSVSSVVWQQPEICSCGGRGVSP